MVLADSAGLRLNWFSVQIPAGKLKLYGILSVAKRDYRNYPHVRQYAIHDQQLAVAVAYGDIPEDFSEVEIDPQRSPQIISTLISEAFIDHYGRRQFAIERQKGETTLLRQRLVRQLPESIKFYEGIVVKPFYVRPSTNFLYGLVIDFASSQQFTDSVATDSIQRTLAVEGYEVCSRTKDGHYISGRLVESNSATGIIDRRGVQRPFTLDNIRLKASYHALRRYFAIAHERRSREIVRLLMIESLSLSKDGYTNVHRLADQYARVAEILERKRFANINITLPTACKSVISIATEPAEIEIRAI